MNFSSYIIKSQDRLNNHHNWFFRYAENVMCDVIRMRQSSISFLGVSLLLLSSFLFRCIFMMSHMTLSAYPTNNNNWPTWSNLNLKPEFITTRIKTYKMSCLVLVSFISRRSLIFAKLGISKISSRIIYFPPNYTREN